MELSEAREKVNRILEEVKKVIVGKTWEVKLAIATLLIEGHLLIEGVPGTGKTLLAKSLARVFGGKYGRIQGHPDVLPSDILGFHVYKLDGSRRFIPGPIMSNIVLFDELNRAPTRSQSALIEPMQEYQVTVDGATYPIPRPFMVIATEVPSEYAMGSYRIMETVGDRFAVKIKSEYNPLEEEVEIIEKSDTISELNIEPVMTPKELLELEFELPSLVYVDKSIIYYMLNIIDYVRRHPNTAYGPSHRAAIHLMKVSRALALIDGRDHVIPDDVKVVAKNVIAHRVHVKEEYRVEGVTGEDLVEEALSKVPVPK